MPSVKYYENGEAPPVSCISTGHMFKKIKILKKIKLRMKLHQPKLETLPSLKFHSVCGDNVKIESGGSVARRYESFCKGIVFSNRPVKINEKIYVRILEISDNWSGMFRIGFTTENPANLRDSLPKYVCPDLTNQPGYWAKAISERHVIQGMVIFFYLNEFGEIHFGFNGEEKGVFLKGLETKGQLWSVMDVYGNCVAVEMLDYRDQLNNRVTIVNDLRPGASVNESRIVPMSRAATLPASGTVCRRSTLRRSNDQSVSDVCNRMSSIDLHSQVDRIPLHPRRFPTKDMVPFQFHKVHGRNVFFNEDRTVAARNDSEYAQGYVFSNRPIRPGEHFIIQVLETQPAYVGAMAFGMTSANPAGLDFSDFPDDCDFLLDRPEYWVVSKDVASSPCSPCEIAFSLSRNGEVFMSKDGRPPQIIMHVDTSQHLWAFMDIFANTSKIKMCGILPETTPICFPAISRPKEPVSPRPVLRHLVQENGTQMVSSQPHIQGSSVQRIPSQPATQSAYSQIPNLQNPVHECTVCYEAAVNSVLYSCGHMCMCFNCALQQWKGRGGGICPICRAPINDVIRTYRS